MTLFKSFLLCVVVTLLVAFASPKDKGVRVGMVMADVEAIAGPATRKKKFKCEEGWKNCLEIWHYDGYNVTFSDGIVDATQ